MQAFLSLLSIYLQRDWVELITHFAACSEEPKALFWSFTVPGASYARPEQLGRRQTFSEKSPVPVRRTEC